MRTLYKAGNSICTQKVLITLREKGLQWDEHNINLFLNQQYDPAYLKLNPKGVVPTLVDDDSAIIESTLICEYLDDRYPEPALRPADAALRARMRLWGKAIDEGIFEATREISFSAMFREKMKAMSEQQRAARFRNVGDPQKRDRFMSVYAEGTDSRFVLYAVAAYEKLFKSMQESLIEHSGPWLMGAQFTLADINVMPFVARLNYLNLLDVWTATRPEVLAWWSLAQQRPSFQFAVTEATLDEEVAAMHTHGSHIKEAIRQRRQEFLDAVKTW